MNNKIQLVSLSTMLLFTSVADVVAADDQASTTSVGMTAIVEELVLPGPKLEVKSLENRDAPFVLRIVESYPHGSSFRYTLEYYALEPGEYDLTSYLQPADGAQQVDLPPFVVTVEATLPPGQIQPNDLEPAELPSLGRYWVWVWLGALVWFAAGYAIMFVGRKSQSEPTTNLEAKPKSLADRLRPAVEAAMAGEITQPELAELERVLFAFWRTRLGLNEIPAAQAMNQVLDNPEGGELMRQLEAWLHHPDPSQDVDLARLLGPYRELPADAMESIEVESIPATEQKVG